MATAHFPKGVADAILSNKPVAVIRFYQFCALELNDILFKIVIFGCFRFDYLQFRGLSAA